MSIFIEGMDYPESCTKCPFSVSYTYGVECSRTGEELNDNSIRGKRCPIREVKGECGSGFEFSLTAERSRSYTCYEVYDD